MPKRCRDRRDVFNGRLLRDLTLMGPFHIPGIRPCQLVPATLLAFSEAMSLPAAAPDAWVHFFEDDYRFLRLWRAPERYIRLLTRFAGVVSPDFSVYRNMPVAQNISHIYRNQLLGARMQADGLNVITNVRLCGQESIPYALAGVPQHSTLAVGLHGCTRDAANRRHVVAEIKILCDLCEPSDLVVYGSAAYGVLDYPQELGIPVHVFGPDGRHRSRTRGAA